eukprot:TRINITY_DN52990_c0_g1_i1.p3 TRINITY_DN52990_c0_g1~~TRINITY_DN52990_c0_g1_i1.p3  ORF type:complete len:101 (-),score=41.32 TRINITY_DN52990_c0_g1_i1:67-369(-)
MFFFFKQKTAYEMLRSLVGSEMCIRDSREIVEAVSRAGLGDGYQCGACDPVLVAYAAVFGCNVSHEFMREMMTFEVSGARRTVGLAVSYTHLTLPTKRIV